MDTIGHRIRVIRKANGWSQEDLAAKMGYTSRSTINKIEKGVNDLSQTNVKKFAEVLGTTTQYLMSGDQEFVESPILTLEEQELVDKFNMLQPENKKMIKNLIDSLLISQ